MSIYIYASWPSLTLLKPLETPHTFLPRGSSGSKALGFRGDSYGTLFSLKSPLT